MTLGFPRREDVKLGRSPLTHVVCQVRYSPILRIATESPASFQDAIRHAFPLFEVEQSFSFQVPVPGEHNAIPSFQMAPNSYRFSDANGHFSVTLAQDSFALATDRYTTWEDFADHLRLVSEAVHQEYIPSPVLRVGLRYINELKPESLGLDSFDEVLRLLQPEITAPLTAEVWSVPRAYATQMDLEDNEGTLAIRFSIPPAVQESSRSFVLDFDYYESGSLPFDGLVERCERFHNVIYSAFRWTIPDENLNVFEPIG
jgi:uncharacterized protein (TIGR04255 family)